MRRSNYVTILFISAVLIMMISSLAGCTGAPKQDNSATGEKRNADKVITPENQKSGQGEMTPQAGVGNGGMPDASGKISGQPGGKGPVSSGVALPSGWPTDVPIMEGFTITVGADKGNGALFVGAAGVKPIGEVADFYTKISGWQVFSDSVTNPRESHPGRSIVLKKADSTLNVMISGSNNGTQINLTYKKGE
jgi:hypothetical protein